MTQAGSRLIESARQALDFAKGEANANEYGVHIPEALDVKAIRQKVDLSQARFAAVFGVNKRTVQDWEQGRRQPSGPSRAFLVVIDREPEAVRRALTAK